MAYDPTNLDTLTVSGRVNIVRLYVGDTDTSNEQLSDDEITFFLSISNDSPIEAAISCAYSLGAKYAHLVDTELEGVLKEDYSKLSDNYYKLSAKLRSQSIRGSLGVSLPSGVSGNTSDPIFTVAQFDNPRAKCDDV